MAIKILVVDDETQLERLILQRFRRKIRAQEYEFVFAHNGFDALKQLSQDRDIVIMLCDINMPQMDGLSLLSKVPEVHPNLKTVMVSAYGDMDNIRSAMNLGAFDFVTKPIDFEDLEITINKTIKAVEVLKNALLADELAEKNEHLKELDELKSRFFTDITHELRTPLTVILGMAEQIKINPEKWLNKGINMIERNGKNLLSFINQMLDLRKLESGKLQLRLIQNNVISYLNYIAESFHSFAESRNVNLHFLSDEQELLMDYDPEKLQSVLSNLLSNAIKYTAKHGNVYLMVSKRPTLEGLPTLEDLSDLQGLEIKVKDTGIGIPADQIEHIFDRFYQVKDEEREAIVKKGESTGIGLALTKELILLMKGSINVESVENKGTTFTLVLPITNEAPKGDPERPTSGNYSWIEKEYPISNVDTEQQTTNNEQRITKTDALLTSTEQKPSLLIVEDSPDVVEYLTSCLEEEYHLEVSENGQIGIDKAIELVPDIIISDVMMPEKDGYELCQTLKNDERTSHIPIILLTAKTDLSARISGLEKGADAYLNKPFHKKELMVRLAKLLELRRKLQERYSSFLTKSGTQPQKDELEDNFLYRIQENLLANLDDGDYGIMQLCRNLGLSRAQLHRKLKALTGYSTSHYIRLIRLHKAKDLLRETDLNISQIAYEVGFRDPKYFTRTFTEEFGKTPIETRK